MITDHSTRLSTAKSPLDTTRASRDVWSDALTAPSRPWPSHSPSNSATIWTATNTAQASSTPASSHSATLSAAVIIHSRCVVTLGNSARP